MRLLNMFKKSTKLEIKTVGALNNYYSPLYLIPEDINYKLTPNLLEQINSLLMEKNHISFEENNTILFADAGEHFETVNCPFCKADLMEFWGEAMDSLYGEDGFTSLDIITPCCYEKTSLHNLIYHYPQGFYMTRITIEPEFEHTLTIEQIANELYQITNMQWRIIQPHY